jgi:phosphate transport system substrate-binding protein
VVSVPGDRGWAAEGKPHRARAELAACKSPLRLMERLEGKPDAQQEATGAGASFPAPLYSKWASDYNKATGVKINYQSVGSGAGLRQIEAKTVDFGASDAPLKDEDLNKKGLVQFPTVIGGVVPVVNIKGIAPGQIKLSGQVLGDIYLGKISNWSDPAIKALNPGVALPDASIAPVRRADGSGTSFIFTNYLSKVNA